MNHSACCMFTNSSDHSFVVDFVPDTSNNVLVACGFSGHGFKFASGIGDLLADMVEGEEGPTSKIVKDMFMLQRFNNDNLQSLKGMHELTISDEGEDERQLCS